MTMIKVSLKRKLWCGMKFILTWMIIELTSFWFFGWPFSHWGKINSLIFNGICQQVILFFVRQVIRYSAKFNQNIWWRHHCYQTWKWPEKWTKKPVMVWHHMLLKYVYLFHYLKSSIQNPRHKSWILVYIAWLYNFLKGCPKTT